MWQQFTDISEESVASIFKAEEYARSRWKVGCVFLVTLFVDVSWHT
jgi:hypothetical protein